MQTSDHSFQHIMSAVLEQKQLWEKLQEENHELRQQLVDLRAGRGIFIEIQNQRFELDWDEPETSSEVAEPAQVKRATTPANKTAKNASAIANQPTTALPPAGVLEEMLLDELSSAMNNRMTTEGKSASSTALNEEQKATLRRELSGSFLLE